MHIKPERKIYISTTGYTINLTYQDTIREDEQNLGLLAIFNLAPPIFKCLYYLVTVKNKKLIII